MFLKEDKTISNQNNKPIIWWYTDTKLNLTRNWRVSERDVFSQDLSNRRLLHGYRKLCPEYFLFVILLRISAHF